MTLSVKAGTFTAHVVADIAAVEPPLGQWIETLLGFVNNQPNATLETHCRQSVSSANQ